jgi:hypothetical protein
MTARFFPRARPAHPVRSRPGVALDHLVVAAHTLDEGIQHVAEALGVVPGAPVRHAAMGTHAARIGLWGRQYIEIIAIDPHAPPPGGPRWYGLDSPALRWRLAAGPFLAHWAVRLARPARLPLWRAQYPQRLAPVTRVADDSGCAATVGVPADGGFPAWQGAGDGIVPTVLQWCTPRHPCDALDARIALQRLRAFHPRAARLAAHLAWLGAGDAIALEDSLAEPTLVAEFETPDGVRTLK